MSEVSQFTRDDRSDSFRLVGDVITAVAETSCQLTIDPTTQERWRQTLALLREFDTLVDDTDIPTSAAMDELRHFDYFADRYPALTPNAVGIDTHARAAQRVEDILEMGNAISTETDPAVFRDLRASEAEETASILWDFTAPQTARQPLFTQKFAPIVNSMGRAANYVDSIIDIRRDIQDGKLEMAPSREFYATLGSAALSEFRITTPKLLHPPVVKKFAEMSIMRLRNRIAHPSPYSSLRSIF